jgi:ribosome biogenesis GTPase / thiamine phosphate phosphatase
MIKTGLIVTSYGRQFIVEVDDVNYQAVTKAKKTDYVVGDLVKVDIINKEQLQIVELIPRDNLVYRVDQNRSKIIASNIDQVIIVIAVKPHFESDFLNNCLLFAESSNIKPIILLNKTDLPETDDFLKKIYELYSVKLSYEIIFLSALGNCDKLKTVLLNQRSLLIGQSGVGKSTITNQIIPEANTRTGGLSRLEVSGCHTTTNAKLYHIDAKTSLIDCPGLQAFGIYDMPMDSLISFFPDFREYLGQCKFKNCRHLNEPGCVLINAVSENLIDKDRFSYLQRLTRSILLT